MILSVKGNMIKSHRSGSSTMHHKSCNSMILIMQSTRSLIWKRTLGPIFYSLILPRSTYQYEERQCIYTDAFLQKLIHTTQWTILGQMFGRQRLGLSLHAGLILTSLEQEQEGYDQNAVLQTYFVNESRYENHKNTCEGTTMFDFPEPFRMIGIQLGHLSWCTNGPNIYSELIRMRVIQSL